MGRELYSLVEQGYPDRNGVIRWSHVSECMFENPDYNPEEGISRWNTPYTHEPFPSRNWRLNSLLAGPAAAGILPIAEPKGTPADASLGWLDLEEEHNHALVQVSYYTLGELVVAEMADLFLQTNDLYHATKDVFEELMGVLQRSAPREESTVIDLTTGLPIRTPRFDRVRVVFGFAD